MRWRENLIAGLGTTLLAACSVTEPELAPERSNQPWRPVTSLSGEIVPGRASSPSAAASALDHRLPPNLDVAMALGSAQIDAQHAYTLAELIDVAESGNPETRIAWNAARGAAEATAVAKSTYLPQVAANVVGAYQVARGRDGLLGYELPGRSSVFGTVSAVSLQWLLFDFGARDARMKEAGQLSVAANVAFTGVHQKVMYEVCMAYYTYVAAKVRAVNARDVLQNADAIEAAAQSRYSQGVGTVIEVSQARQASAQARLMLVQADGSADDAHLALLAALGASPLSKLTVAIPPERPWGPDAQEAADRLVVEALERRPDVLAAYAAQKASAARVDAADAEFKPKLFLSTTGSYTSGRVGVSAFPSFGQQAPTLNVSGSQWGGTVLLGVTVPLYDGGLRDSAKRLTQADADKAAATLERVKIVAAREIVAAQNRLRTSLAAFDAAKALEDAARTVLDAAQDA